MHAKCLHVVWFCDSVDLFLENKTAQGVWVMLTVFFWRKDSLDIVYFSLTLHIQVLLLFPQAQISFEQGQKTCHVKTNKKHKNSALPAPLFLVISQPCRGSVRVGLPGGRHKRALCSRLMLIGRNLAGLSEAMWGDRLHWTEARMSCILLEDGETEERQTPQKQHDLPNHCGRQLSLLAACPRACEWLSGGRGTGHSGAFFSHVIIHPDPSAGKSVKSQG